jgi:membrane-associated phospholipid phosphatase
MEQMKDIVKDYQNALVSRKKLLQMLFIATLIMCITGLTIAVFADMRISRALYNPNQGLAKFMQTFGEFPPFIVFTCFFAGCIVFLAKADRLSIIPKIVWCVVAVTVALVSMFSFVLWFYSVHYVPWMNIIVNVIALGAACTIMWFLPKKSFSRIFVMLGIIFIIAGLAYAVTGIFKTSWGRVRFRDLADDFTPWYSPNGFNRNYSFFSGHTIAACVSTILWLAPPIFHIKNKIARAVLFALPVVLVFIMAYSRLVMGAHYLSDVVFAIFVYTVCFSLVMYFLVRTSKKTS